MNEDERGITPANVTAMTIQPHGDFWEVVIEQGTQPVAVLRAPEPVRRTSSECIALAKAHEDETGKAPFVDADFAEDIDDIIDKPKPWNPPVWQE